MYRCPEHLSAKPRDITGESFGRRVAKLRAELGWTQSQLAERIAISRVALSHIEANVSVPGERTVTLLAGVFGREPHQLAAGTDYPLAKAERLPVVTARHTEVAHQLGVLDALLELVERVSEPVGDRLADDVRAAWRARLAGLLDDTEDTEERRRLRTAIRGLSSD